MARIQFAGVEPSGYDASMSTLAEAYHALAVVDGDTVIWFWIGPHNEYDRLIKRG